MSDYERQIAEDARLFVIEELARQRDGSLNDMSLTRVLDALGIRRSREWLQTQLIKMEELGAVNLRRVASITVATITTAGRDHVERRSAIAGISRPSDED